ncbi:hypothetical protein SLITO_v1c10790 [Spiroplasma litorale]|uniref:Uncharacterized protein n=1 Tax=Spiroplasma litorale TaxID=216942 RepID=A0A0K1W2Y8_9MOLU|nr:hypothetical protein [Spiroplasma litorale]AKX34690.1 hypothetical protein SLITO_v1c10790 [Spiroplasma litorale]
MKKLFIYKFYMLRILKNKLYSITSLIFVIINLLAFCIIFTVSNKMELITTMTMIVLILNFIFLAFFDVTNIADFFIQDHTSNVESLMIRKGKKPTNLFFSRFFANKTASISYCFLIFLLYISFSNITTSAEIQTSITNKYSLGVFVLIPFDLMISAITLILSVTTKKMKVTLPFPWIITTLLCLYPMGGPMILYIINKGDTSISLVSKAQNIGRYQSYLERKNDNKILNKLYDNFMDSKREQNYKEIFNNQNLIKITSDSEKTSSEITNYFVVLSTKSWEQVELYYQNKENKLKDFISSYIEQINYEVRISVEFGENFAEKLLKVQESDQFLKDLISISGEPIDSAKNKQEYWSDTYFNSSDWNVYNGNNGIKKILENVDFTKMAENYSKNDVISINSIIKNQYKYHYLLTNYNNDNYNYGITRGKFKFENNKEWMKNNFIVPFNSSNLNYFIIGLLNDPLTTSGDKLADAFKYENRDQLYNNLNPFMHIFIMANNIGTNDIYYETPIYNSFAFQVPYYANNIYKTNDLETTLNPKAQNEYAMMEPYFYAYTPYLIWIFTSLGIYSISYLAYYSLIYKKSSDN